MAARKKGGFNPGRGGRRMSGGRAGKKAGGGFLTRFALFVALGTLVLWLVDRPVMPEQRGAETGAADVGVDAG